MTTHFPSLDTAETVQEVRERAAEMCDRFQERIAVQREVINRLLAREPAASISTGLLDQMSEMRVRCRETENELRLTNIKYRKVVDHGSVTGV